MDRVYFNFKYYRLLTRFGLKEIIFFLLGCTIFTLFLCMPSFNNTSLAQPTLSTKTIIFSYSMLAVIVLFVVHFLLSKNILTFNLSKLDIVLFLIFIYISTNRYLLNESHGFSLQYLDLVGLMFLYIVLRNFSVKQYLWLGITIMFSGLIQALYGNSQIGGYFPYLYSQLGISRSFPNTGSLCWFPSHGFLCGNGDLHFQVQNNAHIISERN